MIPLRDTQPSYTFPFITVALILLNVAAFLYEFSLDQYELNFFIAHYGLIPTRFQWMDVLTSIFLHGGWMHLIGNMWFLWIYGDNIEDILGHAKYLVFYLLCGVAATMVATHVPGLSQPLTSLSPVSQSEWAHPGAQATDWQNWATSPMHCSSHSVVQQ